MKTETDNWKLIYDGFERRHEKKVIPIGRESYHVTKMGRVIYLVYSLHLKTWWSVCMSPIVIGTVFSFDFCEDGQSNSVTLCNDACAT